MAVGDDEDRVAEAVWSVLHQSLRDLELLVVDAGATDAAMDVVSGHEDPRLRIVRGSAPGAGPARDRGADEARGTYLAFADAAGIVPEHGYAALVDQAERSGSSLVVGNYVRFSPQRLTTRDEESGAYERQRDRIKVTDLPELLRDRMPWHRVFRRAAWREAGLAFGATGRCATTEAYCAFETDVVTVPVHVRREPVGPEPGTLRPDELEEYAEHELACHARLVHQLGADPRYSEPWFTGTLESAAWERVVALLGPAALADGRLDRARTAMARLVQAAPGAASRPLSEEKRLVLGLVAQGDWRRAAICRADGATVRAALTGSDTVGGFVRACFAASRYGVGGAVARVVRVAYLAGLAPQDVDPVPDDELMAAVAAVQEAVAAGLPRGRLTPRERLVATAPVRRGPDRVREHLRRPAPPGPSVARRIARQVVRRSRRMLGRGSGAAA
ncbi:glycosyltransferase family 2 protein [Myceligenerans cantabricum]